MILATSMPNTPIIIFNNIEYKRSGVILHPDFHRTSTFQPLASPHTLMFIIISKRKEVVPIGYGIPTHNDN